MMTEDQVESIIAEIGDLSKEVSTAISKIADKESYDKELVNALKDSFGKLILSISGFKPIDLKPVINIASDISKQNGSIMDMVGRLIHSQDNSEMIKMVTDMVKRNNEFVSKAIEKTDYSKELQSISDNLKRDERLIDNLKVVRTRDGLLDYVNVNYKTASK